MTLFSDLDDLSKRLHQQELQKKAAEEAAKKTEQEKAKAIIRHEEDKRQGMI